MGAAMPERNRGAHGGACGEGQRGLATGQDPTLFLVDLWSPVLDQHEYT